MTPVAISFLFLYVSLKKVAYNPPPPATVRAPLAECPWSAVRHRNRSRAAGAEPRPPNWPAQRRSLSLVGSGVAMPVPRPAPPVSTTFANGAPQGFLWSFAPVSLASGLRCAVAGFPLWAAFVRPLSVPAPLASVPRGRASTQGGRPATGATGLHPPPPKKKNTERACGSPLPALPLFLCAGFARRPSWSCLLSVCWCCRCCRHSPPSPLAASEENSEKWRLRYHEVPKAFRWELANVFNAALVAKALKRRGHLDVEKVG